LKRGHFLNLSLRTIHLASSCNCFMPERIELKSFNIHL
jgi:hypothetical protein